MLAASIRVYRAVEADIRRVVARDDGPRRILGYGGAQRGQILLAPPAVILGAGGIGFEAPFRIGQGTTRL